MWKTIVGVALSSFLLSNVAHAIDFDEESLKKIQRSAKEELASGSQQLHVSDGLCLDAAGDINATGTNVQIWDCNDAPNQKWRLEDGRLVNEGGKCLDVGGDINAPGTNVHIWDCNDAPNQKWRLEGGRLVNEGGKCLDAGGDVNAAGTNVQIWDCNDAPNQKWNF